MDHSEVQITQLDEDSPHIDAVVEWITTEWPEEYSKEVRQMLLDDSNCPPTLIAVAGDAPVAVLAFKCHPPAGSDKNELWINVLFVISDWRSRGIGSHLVHESTARAALHGQQQLFVFTDLPQFYERLGWQRFSFNEAKQMHVLNTRIA